MSNKKHLSEVQAIGAVAVYETALLIIVQMCRGDTKAVAVAEIALMTVEEYLGDKMSMTAIETLLRKVEDMKND